MVFVGDASSLPLNAETYLRLDQRGLPVAVTEAVGTAQQRTTTTAYDAATNVLYTTDANAEVTSSSRTTF